MNSEVLLSICVPTFKRPEIIRRMLESIFTQNVDNKLFEVCITDNSPTDETKKIIEEEFFELNNLHYKKVSCEGFLNSIEALKFGQGKFLKLHNDYSAFKEGSLQRMIDEIAAYQSEEPVIFFSMSELPNAAEISEFENFNEFIYNIHYFSTWSSSFAIWKSDFNKLIASDLQVNHMYPHTSLLFRLTKKRKYIVDNFEYVTNIDLKKKGGYNLVDNFVRIYLSMVREDLLYEHYIELKTYKKIEKGIIKFSARWYANSAIDRNKYTFSFEKDNRIVRKTCGFLALMKYFFYKKYYLMKYKVELKRQKD